jgi:hypothetical protein
MKDFTTHTFRFLFFLVIQALVLNQLEIGVGIQLMVYPLFILLLPFEMGVVGLLVVALCMGVAIDIISNTFGLHTSSLLLVAYIRPILFSVYAPRDGYENLKEGSSFVMGARWFVLVYGWMLLIHHTWFFSLELFRLDEFFFILQKVVLSFPLSFLLSWLLQLFLVSKPKER